MKSAQFITLLLLLPLIACGGKVYSDAEIQQICLDRKRDAMGPHGEATISANSETGVGLGLSVSVSDDYVLGRNPETVYAQCLQDYHSQNEIVQQRMNGEN